MFDGCDVVNTVGGDGPWTEEDGVVVIEGIVTVPVTAPVGLFVF